jgi:AcrR family transcriptional regulator
MVMSQDVATPPGQGERGYHHGNLRQALIATALAMAQENGPERVSVREVARRLGVSPGAPFRHFPNRRALMTAIAEEAAVRLRIEVRKSMGKPVADPLGRLRSIGRGYLAWAHRHPAHFRIISARDQIDIAGSAALRQEIHEVRGATEQALVDAQAMGRIGRGVDVPTLALLARATVYGLARMALDGHFAQWNVAPDDEAAASAAALDLLVDLMAASSTGA